MLTQGDFGASRGRNGMTPMAACLGGTPIDFVPAVGDFGLAGTRRRMKVLVPVPDHRH
jgi:hypothetical protein